MVFVLRRVGLTVCGMQRVYTQVFDNMFRYMESLRIRYDCVSQASMYHEYVGRRGVVGSTVRVPT